eukprot:PhF_6_TR29174/c0_g1_i1/m.42652
MLRWTVRGKNSIVVCAMLLYALPLDVINSLPHSCVPVDRRMVDVPMTRHNGLPNRRCVIRVVTYKAVMVRYLRLLLLLQQRRIRLYPRRRPLDHLQGLPLQHSQQGNVPPMCVTGPLRVHRYSIIVIPGTFLVGVPLSHSIIQFATHPVKCSHVPLFVTTPARIGNVIRDTVVPQDYLGFAPEEIAVGSARVVTSFGHILKHALHVVILLLVHCFPHPYHPHQLLQHPYHPHQLLQHLYLLHQLLQHQLLQHPYHPHQLLQHPYHPHQLLQHLYLLHQLLQHQLLQHPYLQHQLLQHPYLLHPYLQQRWLQRRTQHFLQHQLPLLVVLRGCAVIAHVLMWLLYTAYLGVHKGDVQRIHFRWVFAILHATHLRAILNVQLIAQARFVQGSLYLVALPRHGYVRKETAAERVL